MNDDVVIALEDVDVEFDRTRLFGLAESETLRAVNGVSLEIRENEMFALVGESGCGKTTLGKTAIGVNRPASGRVLYRGQDVFKTKDRSGLVGKFRNRGANEFDYDFSDIRRNLQIIHQDPGTSLDSNATVENILSEPLRRWKPDLSRVGRREQIRAFLEYVGLTPAEDFSNRYPHQMSGGEQQRVAIIRAFLMEPDLILADESISALDVSLRIDMIDLMLDLQEMFQTSYLFITHNLSSARYITKKTGGRIGIMYLGNLVEVGTVDEIINDPQHPYTKALLWAVPDFASRSELGETETLTEAPLRDMDVPNLTDVPTGCPFHPRCPEAREVCRQEFPESISISETHNAACYRGASEHEYWESAKLTEEGELEPTEDA